jgi:uncharacterized membrane protein
MQERRFSRTVQAINLALLVLLFVGSLWVYPLLPDQVPKHIGFGGDVTYGEATLLGWLTLPCLGAFFVASAYGIAYHVARDPQRVLHLDISNLDTFRTLSPRRKRIVTDIIRAIYHGCMTPLLLTFILTKIEFYLIAVTSRTLPLFTPWFTIGTMSVGFLGIYLLRDWWLLQ